MEAANTYPSDDEFSVIGSPNTATMIVLNVSLFIGLLPVHRLGCLVAGGDAFKTHSTSLQTNTQSYSSCPEDLGIFGNVQKTGCRS